MRMIMILLDSLNRRYFPCYQPNAKALPNFQRVIERSQIFTNHWAASLPCIPARRDLFTGRMDFLERPWGPLEPFDCTFLHKLREQQIYTHMITDHYHYFESSGEHYCQQFDSWEFIRGQEFDPWAGNVQRTVTHYPTKEDYDREMEKALPKRYGVFSSQYEKIGKNFCRKAFQVKGFLKKQGNGYRKITRWTNGFSWWKFLTHMNLLIVQNHLKKWRRPATISSDLIGPLIMLSANPLRQ